MTIMKRVFGNYIGIAYFILIIACLLFIYDNKIPFIKRLLNKESKITQSELPKNKISYS